MTNVTFNENKKVINMEIPNREILKALLNSGTPIREIMIDGVEFRLIDNENLTNKNSYFISKAGDVYSVWSDKFLKHLVGDLNYYHYKHVSIRKNRIKSYIHHLVADTWLTRPDDEGVDYVINHKDNNHHNNHVDNLEYVTRKENSSALKSRPLESKHVPHLYIDYLAHLERGGNIKNYDVVSAMSKFNASSQSILKCLQKETFTETTNIYDKLYEFFSEPNAIKVKGIGMLQVFANEVGGE